MSAAGKRPSRRLVVGSVALALFVLLDIGLFGWLIFRALSRQQIQQVLLETRKEAEGLARQIAGRADLKGEDLYTAVALAREVQTYVDSVLTQRDIVQTVEILDREGRLVFRTLAETSIPVGDARPPRLESGEIPESRQETTFEERQTVNLDLPSYDLSVPIGDLGVLHIGISRTELTRRIEVLRGELIGTATVIGVVTVALLLLAYAIIWWLWRRGRRLEEQAEEAERLAYIGTLASGLAHEIRNPLNSLNLNMQMLEEDLGRGGAPSSRLLALTREEIGRLERLVTDFLRYARPRPLELKEVSPVELLERCRDLLGTEIRLRGTRLSVDDESRGALVRVDAEQMGQLLINLVQNSLAATESVGRQARIGLAARLEGGCVALEVTDNGAGISEADRHRIFDLFYSTRKGGTGLGLAIVDRIARAHEGRIETSSTPGVGTTVRILLPAVRPTAAPARAGSAREKVELEPSMLGD